MGKKLQPKLRFRGFTDDWEQRKLKDLIIKGGSGGTPNSRIKKYYIGNIPFLNISDISTRNIQDSAEKRKLDLLQKKKTALLRQIFEQKLRFKGYNNPWEPRRLREIATVVGGGTPDTNNPLYWNGDINWFTPAEIGSNAYASKSERRITEEGLEHSSAKLLPADRTILFTSRASIGLTAILTVDACTNQGFQSLVVSDRTDVFFLFGLCNQIKTQAIRNAAGSTFIEISGKQLAKIPLQIPSLDEQRRIGKVVRTMDSLIAVATRKIDLLTLKKKAWSPTGLMCFSSLVCAIILRRKPYGMQQAQPS